jgi:hypothetical protein
LAVTKWPRSFARRVSTSKYTTIIFDRTLSIQSGAVGEKNWIVVTRDERIRYNVAERQAMRRAKVRAFVLAAQGDLRADMLAQNFLRALAKVRRVVEKQSPPFIAKISRSGDVTILEF